MRAPRDPDKGLQQPDRDGVRVVHKPDARRTGTWAAAALVAVTVIAALAWWQYDARAARVPGARPAPADAGSTAPQSRDADTLAAQPQASRATTQMSTERLPLADSNDLASHFKPGDPEPTGAELIDALHEAGVRTGIGAFNPPGTSPPLQGLAVPPDFPLPAGYVRHHQVTDEGVPLEPILMFAPDFALLDARGRAVPLPANRVVPPELAPPGLPLRPARIPTR